MRRALGMVVLVLAAVSAVLVTPSAAGADAPALTSGNGITVSGWRWITSRTFEVDISTAKVSANAVNGPHRVRVTLPATYFNNTTTRFPVLYLLHGGAGGNSAQWTTGGGDEENITRNASLITVMPDGGKVGWFTNWVDQSQGAQAWRDFYIDQVIPWIDGNLRTIASKSGRAIAGLSMGGFGAIRFAQDRPVRQPLPAVRHRLQRRQPRHPRRSPPGCGGGTVGGVGQQQLRRHRGHHGQLGAQAAQRPHQRRHPTLLLELRPPRSHRAVRVRRRPQLRLLELRLPRRAAPHHGGAVTAHRIGLRSHRPSGRTRTSALGSESHQR